MEFKCHECKKKGVDVMAKLRSTKLKPVSCSECSSSGYISPMAWWLGNVILVFLLPFILILLAGHVSFAMGAVGVTLFVVIYYAVFCALIPLKTTTPTKAK